MPSRWPTPPLATFCSACRTSSDKPAIVASNSRAKRLAGTSWPGIASTAETLRSLPVRSVTIGKRDKRPDSSRARAEQRVSEISPGFAMAMTVSIDSAAPLRAGAESSASFNPARAGNSSPSGARKPSKTSSPEIRLKRNARERHGQRAVEHCCGPCRQVLRQVEPASNLTEMFAPLQPGIRSHKLVLLGRAAIALRADLVREARVEFDEAFLDDAAKLRLPILAQLLLNALNVELPGGRELLVEQFLLLHDKVFFRRRDWFHSDLSA